MIVVREFEETDRDVLRRLYACSRNAAFTWQAAEAHQLLDFDAHTEGERIVVAVIDGHVLGFASIWEADSFLHNLFVHPSATRQGIGHALLSYCSQYFSKPPTLKCMKANINATRFYETQGWRVLREDVAAEGPYFLMGKG